MDSPLEIIDAFIDGQRVETAALKNALASIEGRDYFVDAWLLREAVQEGQVASQPSATPQTRGARQWLVAAAVIGGLTTGFGVGYLTGVPSGSPTAPTAPAVTAEVTPTPAFPVPAPTRVIQLEFSGSSKPTGGN